MPTLTERLQRKATAAGQQDVNLPTPVVAPIIPDPQSISIEDYSKQIVSTAAQSNVPLNTAEDMVQEQTWKQAVFGGLAKGGLQTANAISKLPPHLLRRLDDAARNTVRTAATQPTGMIWMPEADRDRLLASKSFWGIAEEELAPINKWIEGGINSVIKSHPEWQGKPPENVIDLLTSPKKLVNSIAQSIPVLVGAGLATATGHPVAALSIMYAAEGQEAHDEAIASGATAEEAERAQVLYGTVAAAIEYAQVYRGLELLKGMRGAILTRSAQKVARTVGKTGQRTITKQILLTAIEESAEEMAQGTWQEQVAKHVFGKEPEGGLLGFVDRRAQEAVIATALTGITGGVGGISTAVSGKVKKAEAAFEVPEAERKAEAIKRQEKELLPDVTEDEFVLPGEEAELTATAEEVVVTQRKVPAQPVASKLQDNEEIEPEVGAVRDIPKKGAKTKERKFITSVKEEFPDLATRVSGEYIPRSTDELSIKASNLIKDDIAAAENLAKTKSTDKAVATASELIKHYVAKSQEAITLGDKNVFLDKAAEVAHASAARLTELGRAVQAASILTRLTPEGQLRFAASVINDYNNKVESIRGGLLGLRKKIPHLTKEESAEIIAEAKRIENMVDGTAKAEAFWNLQQKIHDLVPAPLYRKLVNIWKAGLLTGMKTHGLNTLSNLSHGVTESIKEYPAAVIDSGLSIVTHKRTIAARFGGTARGVIQGTEKGWHYVKTGFDTRNVATKLDWRRVSFGTSKVARFFQAYEQTVFRLMGAGDQPFYYGAKAKSIFSQAVAQAKTKKLKGAERDAFVKSLIEGPSDEMLRYAVIDAETAVFINRTVLGDMARAVQKLPGGEIVVPFARTPAAIATQIVNYSPAGAVKTLIQNIGKDRFDQRLFSQGMGRAATGTAVLAVGRTLFQAGMLALAPPDNEREKKLWELEGKKPNSILIGGKWRTPESLGPAGNVLLLGGYFAEALEAEGSPTKAIGKAVSGTARVLAEQTFVRNVNQAAEAVLNPDLSAELFFAQLSGSTVPTLIADYARAIDKKERRAEGLIGRLKTRIPFLREEQEPKVNVFGQDLARYGGNALETMLDPTRPAIIRQDYIVEEMRRLWDNKIKVSPTLLGDREGYKSLTTKENTELWQRAGQKIYFDLGLLFGRPSYHRADDKAKGKQIETIVRDDKNAARAEAIRATIGSLKDIDKLKEHRDSGLLTEDVARILRLTQRTKTILEEEE